jgi:hypothetical protein
MAQIYQFASATAAFLRNVQSARKFALRRPLFRLNPQPNPPDRLLPASAERRSDLTLDAQVRLWIERTHRTGTSEEVNSG